MFPEECCLTHAPVLTSGLVETAPILTKGKPVFNNNQPHLCKITMTPHNKRNISKTNIYFNYNPTQHNRKWNFFETRDGPRLSTISTRFHYCLVLSIY